MNSMPFRKFCRIVQRVMETLPAEFEPFLDNLVVDVEEEPSDDFLRQAGFTEEEIEAGETLYGYFIPCAMLGGYAADELDVGERPDRILIFKRPLEEDFPDRRELLLEIRKTVIHELAHHFGFDERDLDRFEEVKDP